MVLASSLSVVNRRTPSIQFCRSKQHSNGSKRSSYSPRPLTVSCKEQQSQQGCDIRYAAVATLSALTVAISAPAALAKTQTYVAELTPTQGYEGVSGIVKFEESKTKNNKKFLAVDIDIKGLTPGEHGWNIHEVGGVNCADGTCTGASFNPEFAPHGKPDAVKKFGASACHYIGDGCIAWHHAGDLGNVLADDNGQVKYDVGYDLLKVDGSSTCLTKKPDGFKCDISGRSLVIHQGKDDFKTQDNDGDAGPIIAFGTIKPL